VKIHQDASVYASLLNGADQVTHTLALGRRAFVHVVRGKVVVNGEALATGDAAKISDTSEVTLAKAEVAEVLLFDLP
jgi:quercetin 2,3-dioxygenase